MTKPTILVVDDELSIRESFTLILENDFTVETAASGETALQKASSQSIDLVFLDIRMSGMTGMETLPKLKQMHPDTPVIMVTAVNDVQSAGEAIKNGAEDYIVKPFDVDEVLKKAKSLIERKRLKTEAARLGTGALLAATRPAIFGRGRRSEELREAIRQAAEGTGPVLLMGEAGSEFDDVAQNIHLESNRAQKPFEIVRYSPESREFSAQIELFGQIEGTSLLSPSPSPGAIHRAKGGTLYLSHVSQMPGLVQDVCAQWLDDDGRPQDVRVIASWVNRLPEDQAVSALHPTLFEAVSVISIEIPSLSERLAEFDGMVEDLITHFAHKHHRKEKKIGKEAIELLEGYPYKGGMMELQGIIENIVLTLPQEEISAEDLPLDVWIHSRVGGKIPYSQFTEKFEKLFLEHAKQIFGSNTFTLSKRLGLSPTALQAKLEHHHLVEDSAI